MGLVGVLLVLFGWEKRKTGKQKKTIVRQVQVMELGRKQQEVAEAAVQAMIEVGRVPRGR